MIALRRTKGIKWVKKIRTEEIRERTGVGNIREKNREARLIWLENVGTRQRRYNNHYVKDGSDWTTKCRKITIEGRDVIKIQKRQD